MSPVVHNCYFPTFHYPCLILTKKNQHGLFPLSLYGAWNLIIYNFSGIVSISSLDTFISLLVHQHFKASDSFLFITFGTGALFVILSGAPNLKMLGLLQVMLGGFLF